MAWNWRHYATAAFILSLTLYNGAVFIERSKRGRRLTQTTLGPNGVAGRSDGGTFRQVAPETLRAEAARVLGRPITLDVYSLARVLWSEGAHDSVTARRVRAWALYNDWQKLRSQHGPARWPSLTSVVTFSTHKGESGFYGEQAGRRFSTARDPYEGDYADAEALFREFTTGKSPIGTATKFVDTGSLGKQKGSEGKTLASLEKEWGGKFRHIEGDLWVMG